MLRAPPKNPAFPIFYVDFVRNVPYNIISTKFHSKDGDITMLHTPRRAFSSQYTPRDLPIRLHGAVRESIVDGPRLRFVIFVQGCPHHCPGCHNPASHDPDGGYVSSTTRLWAAIQENPLLRGVTFSGGEPFLWGEELSEIGRAAHEAGLDVMTYSGYTYETLLERAKTEESVKKLLTVTDFLVDGPFILAQRDLTLKFRGSRNQRILDVRCYPNSENARVIAGPDVTGEAVF